MEMGKNELNTRRKYIDSYDKNTSIHENSIYTGSSSTDENNDILERSFAVQVLTRNFPLVILM